MRTIKPLVSVLLLLGLLTLPPVQGQAPADQPFRLERSDTNVYVREDGRWSQVTEQRIKIQTRAGLQQAAQMVFVHNVSMQKFEVLEAFTQKADGSRVDVKKDAIFTRDLPASTGAPMFADVKVVVVVFPEVAVGDSVSARVRHEQVQPMFSGYYTNLFMLTPHTLVDANRITLRAPEKLALRIDNEGYTEKRGVEAGIAVYEWTAGNTIVEPIEAGSVAPLDYSRRLSISTFPDFGAFAQAYAARAAEKAAVTPAIQKLADELTAGVGEPREQARRLFDWVTQNIRYVGIFLGMGAVVPHAAEQVLANRYGDCKDQVTLLTALLAAKGIEARTALVSLGNSYWVGKLPVLQNFNHVIVYVPSLDVWADPTSTLTPFGRLPAPVQGKMAVLAPTGELKTTPLDRQTDNVTVRRVRYEILADGTVAGETIIEAKGIRAERYRQRAKELTPEKMGEYVRSMTSGQRYKGEGRVSFLDTPERTDTMRVKAEYTLTGGIDWPGAGAFEIPEGFRGGEYMATQIRQDAASRKRPRATGGVETLIEEYEILLPPKMKIVSLPKPINFQNVVASYESTIRLDGRRVFVTRKLIDLHPGPVMSPTLFKSNEEKSTVISRDLRAQISYAEE